MSKQTTSTRNKRIREAAQQRRAAEHANVQQAILTAAEELLLEHGYEQFSLRHVAERSGYVPGTVYLYFRNKDDLVFTLAQDGFRRFQEALAYTVTQNHTPRERLLAMGRAYVTFALSNPVYYQLMFLHRTDFLTSPPEEDMQLRIASFRLLSETVQEAINAGLLPYEDVQATSDALWGLLHGVVTLALRMNTFDAERTERAVAMALQLVTDLMSER